MQTLDSLLSKPCTTAFLAPGNRALPGVPGMPGTRTSALALGLFSPGVALAHGDMSGLVFIGVGLPYAVGAYLIGIALLLWTASPGHRWQRARWLALGFPVWMTAFIWPFSHYADRLGGVYVVWWSLGLPTALLVAAGLLAFIRRQHGVQARP